MKWFLAYLAVGFVIALISYRFQRRNRNVRKVKKAVGEFGVIMFYTWLWVIALPLDLRELFLWIRRKRFKFKPKQKMESMR